MAGKLDMWIKEIHQETAGTIFKVQETLFAGQSPYQQIDVVRTCSHGGMLLNDGIVMLSERDEFIYHEMIAHVPLFVHPRPKNVLVIGGGDGGTVREILKHARVERVVMVEIDEMVVQACRKHLPAVSCALDDPRLELLFENGVKYVKQTKETFDVVIIDSTDPIGPAEPLFNAAFYENVANILTADGILITQAESPFYDQKIQLPMFKNQRPFFKKLHLYLFATMTYPGGLWSFGYASRGRCPLRDFHPERVSDSGLKMQYYNPGIHRSAFMLPNFVAENLAAVLDPINWA